MSHKGLSGKSSIASLSSSLLVLPSDNHFRPSGQVYSTRVIDRRFGHAGLPLVIGELVSECADRALNPFERKEADD